jgi:hypothetical protein
MGVYPEVGVTTKVGGLVGGGVGELAGCGVGLGWGVFVGIGRGVAVGVFTWGGCVTAGGESVEVGTGDNQVVGLDAGIRVGLGVLLGLGDEVGGCTVVSGGIVGVPEVIQVPVAVAADFFEGVALGRAVCVEVGKSAIDLSVSVGEGVWVSMSGKITSMDSSYSGGSLSLNTSSMISRSITGIGRGLKSSL